MNECGVCKSKIKSLLYCNGCFQRAKSVAERRGRVEELEKIIKILSYPDMDEIYETRMIMKHCKRRLLELEKRELK